MKFLKLLSFGLLLFISGANEVNGAKNTFTHSFETVKHVFCSTYCMLTSIVNLNVLIDLLNYCVVMSLLTALIAWKKSFSWRSFKSTLKDGHEAVAIVHAKDKAVVTQPQKIKHVRFVEPPSKISEEDLLIMSLVYGNSDDDDGNLSLRQLTGSVESPIFVTDRQCIGDNIDIVPAVDEDEVKLSICALSNNENHNENDFNEEDSISVKLNRKQKMMKRMRRYVRRFNCFRVTSAQK